MLGLIDIEQHLEFNALLYRQPVQCNQYRGDVVVFAGLADDTRCIILNPLKAFNEFRRYGI